MDSGFILVTFACYVYHYGNWVNTWELVEVVSKEKLLSTLNNSIALEEEGSGLIGGVVMVMIEESSLSGDTKKRLLEIVETIKDDSIQHGRAIRGVIDYVEQTGGFDEF